MMIIKNLFLSFKEQNVFDNLNLEIEAGSMVALSGPSGVGKSSLLRIMAGLQKPTRGNVENAFEHTGMIFQDFQLFPHLSIYDNIILAPKTKKQEGIEIIRNRAKQLMAQYGITSLQEKLPSQLSGGEKQRVAIVRALMMNPSLLLVDEATSSLDEKNAEAFMEHLVELNNKGITIVFISHQINLVNKYAKHIIQL